MDMALLAMRQRDMSLGTIKGLLLCVAWPFPSRGITSDVTYAIAGALPHVAMQCGLHHPTATQDFARVKINLTDFEIQRRSQLWAFTVIVYQRLCSLMGQTPFVLVESTQDIEQRRTLMRNLTPSLRLQLRLQSIVARSCQSFLEIGLVKMNDDQERAMEVVISLFTAQIKDLEHEVDNAMDQFHVHVCHMHMLVFHFYKKRLVDDSDAIMQIYIRSCLLLEHLDEMDKDTQVLAYAPYQVIAGSILAAYTLLRLIKTSASRFIDLERAKSSFYLSLNISKRLIVETDDLPSRNLQLLTLLWNSERIFKNEDGSEHATLRVRSRLAMSSVFDALWWWRTEFGGQAGAFSKQDGKAEGIQVPATSTLPQADPINGTLNPQLQAPSYLDDQFLTDLGWAFSDNFFFSDFSMEPSSTFEQYGFGLAGQVPR